jgi:hypothetical protein
MKENKIIANPIGSTSAWKVCPVTGKVCSADCAMNSNRFFCIYETEQTQQSTGWICPRCQKVHAPQVLTCDCK